MWVATLGHPYTCSASRLDRAGAMTMYRSRCVARSTTQSSVAQTWTSAARNSEGWLGDVAPSCETKADGSIAGSRLRSEQANYRPCMHPWHTGRHGSVTLNLTMRGARRYATTLQPTPLNVPVGEPDTPRNLSKTSAQVPTDTIKG